MLRWPCPKMVDFLCLASMRCNREVGNGDSLFSISSSSLLWYQNLLEGSRGFSHLSATGKYESTFFFQVSARPRIEKVPRPPPPGVNREIWVGAPTFSSMVRSSGPNRKSSAWDPKVLSVKFFGSHSAVPTPTISLSLGNLLKTQLLRLHSSSPHLPDPQAILPTGQLSAKKED